MSSSVSSKQRARPAPAAADGYRILHCMRAPVGGLFRHVMDLAREQNARGHSVGIISDKNAADALTVGRLRTIEPVLKLGLSLVPMGRQPGLSDITAALSAIRLARTLKADILHGHGAKGGAYARLAARVLKLEGAKVAAIYTPHGGSLHYQPDTFSGAVFIGIERLLRNCTDGLIFESEFARRAYAELIGLGSVPARVIANGLERQDFITHKPAPGAADFLFIGELRFLKGVDVLLAALEQVRKRRPVSAVIVGAGPDAEEFKAMAGALGLRDCVSFPGTMAAREAFALGRCLVVPSRAESFPYIVLEAGAAGMPLIATNVGGIPEIVAGTPTPLIPPGDVAALTDALDAFLDSRKAADARAKALKTAVGKRFTVEAMAGSVLDFYAETLPLNVSLSMT
jgi:glycosyltransferase involved in cell wall biosynthesis